MMVLVTNFPRDNTSKQVCLSETFVDDFGGRSMHSGVGKYMYMCPGRASYIHAFSMCSKFHVSLKLIDTQLETTNCV